MAKSVFNFHSEVLNFHETVTVLMPDPNVYNAWQEGPCDDEMEVLYLLHGLRGGSHTWTAYSSIERYLYESGRKMVIVMPEMGNDFYTDHEIGWKYFTYVSEELPRIMQTFLRITPDRERTYVAGLSMGGYGALKLALTHPEQYGFAASYSGALDLVKILNTENPEPSASTIIKNADFLFGGVDKVAGSKNDLFHLLDTFDPAAPKPKLYISCGSADGLFEQSVRFNQKAREKGFETIFHEERNMGHAWSFWDKEAEKLVRTLL
ncbi:MAG: esterase family protein [Clostridia bacterium]|nr:esterase family protein [Clostridia bacterium]